MVALPNIAVAQTTALRCEAGPVHRDFGATAWLVYGCDDGKSLVVASDEGNPASPFVFVVGWQDGGYGVSGEGNGSRDASAAALQELRSLTSSEIQALYVETQSVKS